MKLKFFVAIVLAGLMVFGAFPSLLTTAPGGVVAISSVNALPSASTNSTLTVGTLLGGETVTNQNPLSNSGGIQGDVTGVTYADSMIFEFSNGSYIPWTANSWQITNGGKTLTFNLVQNASWVNGTAKAGAFTSQDVVYTFDALMANSSLDVNGIDAYLVSVTATNTYTVVFQLSQANIMAFYYIGAQTIIPYAWHSYVSNISDIGNYFNMNIGHQISLGPMSLQSVSGNYITFIANPYFFKGKPHFQKEVWEQFTSTSSQIDSLKTGAIDATYVDSNSIYPSLLGIKGIQTVVYKDTFNLDLWFDVHVAPYNNTNFRRGLACLINNSQIVQKAEGGLGGLANYGGLPWTLSNYYNTSDANYSNNVTRANQYFQAAGLSIGSSSGLWQYPNGTVVTVKMQDIPQSDWDTAMSLIQSALTADNFATSLSVVPTGTWATNIFGVPHFDVSSFFNFGPLFANPWFDLWAAFDTNGIWNFGHYSNPTIDSLLNQSAAMVNNPSALNSTLKEVQGIVADQLPLITVMGSDLFFAYRSNAIGGVYPNVQMSSPLDSLYAHPATSSSGQGTSGTSNNTVYYIVGGVVVVAIVAIGVGVAIRSRNAKKKE